MDLEPSTMALRFPLIPRTRRRIVISVLPKRPADEDIVAHGERATIRTKRIVRPPAILFSLVGNLDPIGRVWSASFAKVERWWYQGTAIAYPVVLVPAV